MSFYIKQHLKQMPTLPQVNEPLTSNAKIVLLCKREQVVCDSMRHCYDSKGIQYHLTRVFRYRKM